MDMLHWWLATSVARPMALKRLRYRISRFGTIALPQEVRRATYCIMKLEMQAVRGVTYYSRERIPLQTVHGWITARDADGYVVNRDWDWRFDKQRWLLFEVQDFQTTLNQCFIANKQTEVLLQELAKKPNIPPIPPSIPPINYDNFFGKVPTIIHGYESITIKTRVEGDFDVEFVYDTREVSGCSPVPIEIPRGPAPLEDELPKPGGDNGIEPGPAFTPPTLPTNAPPLGGTAKIPEGYQGADQSSPPNAGPVIPPGATRTRYVAIGVRVTDYSGNCNNPSTRDVVSDKAGIIPAASFSNVELERGGPNVCGSVGKGFNILYNGQIEVSNFRDNWIAGPSFVVEYY